VKLRGGARLYARSWASPLYPHIIRLRFRGNDYGADFAMNHDEALALAASLVAAVEAARGMEATGDG
jgi:hypothetical protein